MSKTKFRQFMEEQQHIRSISNVVNRKFLRKYVVKIYRRNK